MHMILLPVSQKFRGRDPANPFHEYCAYQIITEKYKGIYDNVKELWPGQINTAGYMAIKTG